MNNKRKLWLELEPKLTFRWVIQQEIYGFTSFPFTRKLSVNRHILTIPIRDLCHWQQLQRNRRQEMQFILSADISNDTVWSMDDLWWWEGYWCAMSAFPKALAVTQVEKNITFLRQIIYVFLCTSGSGTQK